MPIHRRVIAAAIAGVVAIVACDSPTAPQVRDAVEKVQHDLFLAPNGFGGDVRRMILSGVRQTRYFPVGLLEIERNGHREQYLATLMERVYLPVAGSGGAPYVRRTLMAWDSVTRRGFALASDDSVSAIVRPTNEAMVETSPAHLFGRLGFVTYFEDGSVGGWVGSEGALTFNAGPATGPCTIRSAPEPGAPLYDPWGRHHETCEQVQFHVSTNAILEHRNPDGERSLFDRLAGRQNALHIVSQDVPGVRIVTQCIEPNETNWQDVLVPGCTNRFAFWRNPSVFATSLGVEFGRIRALQDQRFYAQSVVDGSGPEIPLRQFSGMVRYSVFTPSGRVVFSADSAVPAKDTILSNVFSFDPNVRDGSRTLVFMSSRYFVRSSSQFGLHVVDVTVLPCPAGTRRYEAFVQGHQLADGHCVPAPKSPQP